MTRSVKVEVAGQSLAIRTDANTKYVEELAAFVSSKIEEIRGSGRFASTQSLALLVAMNIADELFQLRDSQTQLKRQVRERTRNILRSLDTAIQ